MNTLSKLSIGLLLRAQQKHFLLGVLVFAGTVISLVIFSFTSLYTRQAKADGTTDAMMVYSNQDITATPKYRIWDGSAWGSELDASQISGDIAQMRVKYAPTRDEAILIIQSTTGEISAQVFNGTSWGSKTVLATYTGNGIGADEQATRGIAVDIFYEQTSGDAVVVYADNTADPNYRIWDGSTWSSETDINIPTTGQVNVIKTDSRDGSDEGAMIIVDANSDIYGMRWTGSAWDNMGVSTSWGATASLYYKNPIDVRFEHTSGDIMYAWGYATVGTAHFRYRTYEQSTSTLGSVTNVTNANNAGVVHWLKLTEDNTSGSDKIMLAVQDAGTDLNSFQWSGSAWSAVHTEHSSATEDTLNMNFDMAYETHASNQSDLWLTFGNGSTVTRKKYESTGTWGTSTTAGDDTAVTKIIAQPNSGAMLAVNYEDNTSASDNITAFQLTGGGTTWSAPTVIWDGGVTRNLGHSQIDIDAQKYNSSVKAMMVYDTQTLTEIPKYRMWDGSSWGSEQSANAIDGSIAHLALKFSPIKNEGILMTQSTTGKLQSQVWNGTSWGTVDTLQTMNGNGAGPDTQATYGQAFDLAYEQVSGDAVVVYNDNTADPNYRVWNGTSWGAATNLDVPTTGLPNVIELTAKPGTDIIAMLQDTVNSDVYGALWDGSAWDDMNGGGVEPAWDLTASTNIRHPIDVAFEKTSGDAMFIWADATSTDYYYRTLVGSTLSSATLLDITASGGVGHWVTLESDPSTGSDKILLGVEDAGLDINTREWTGSAWDSAHTEHTASSEDIIDRNFDLTYETYTGHEGKAWLTYSNSSTIYRKQYNGSASWGTATAMTSGDDTAFIDLEAQPISGALLAVAYEDNTSASDDIKDYTSTNGGSTWSSAGTIWGGPIARNYGFDRVDIETVKYIAGITISGTCKAYDQTTDCGDTGEVRVAVNGVLNSVNVQSTVAGTWSITNFPKPATNDILTIFIDGASDADEAVAVTKYSGNGDVTGIKLIKEGIVIGSNQDNSISQANLAVYDYSNDEDIYFEATSYFGYCGPDSETVAFCADYGGVSARVLLYIDSGDTLVMASGVVNLGKLQVAGTYTSGTESVTLYSDGTNTTCGASDQMPICVDGGGSFDVPTSVRYRYSSATMIRADSYETLIAKPEAIVNGYLGSGTFNITTLLQIDACSNQLLDASSANPNLNFTGNGQLDIGNGCSATFNAGSGTYTFSSTGVASPLSISGTSAFTANTSTVVYSGNYSGGDTSIPAAVFYNLTINNSGENFVTAGAVTINNDLDVTAGTFKGANDVIVRGDATGNGTVNFTAGTFWQKQNNIIKYFGGNTPWSFSNLSFGESSGQPPGSDSSSRASGTGAITISGVLTIYMHAQTLYLGSKTWNFIGSGTPLVSSLGALNYGTSTVVFSGGSATNIPGITGGFYNLELKPNADDVTYTMVNGGSSYLTVNNNLTVGDGVSTGVIVSNANDLTVSVGGTLTIADQATYVSSDTSTLSVKGSFINNGTFTHSNGTFEINPSSGGQVSSIGGTSDTTFYNFTNTVAGSIMEFAAGRTYTFAGNLSVQGAQGNHSVLRSSSAGSQWYISASGSKNLDQLDVKDSGCTASNPIQYKSTLTSLGNNGICWDFAIRGGGGSGNAPVDGGSSGGSGGTSGGGQGGGSGGSVLGNITKFPSDAASDSSVGTVAWSNTGNVFADGGGVASAGTSTDAEISNFLKVTNFGFNIPISATIQGVVVTIKRRSQTGTSGMSDNSIKLVIANSYAGTDKSAGEGWYWTVSPSSYESKTFGSSSDLWGNSLTPAIINSPDFGFGISVQYAIGTGAATALVDYINMTVYYEEGGGSGGSGGQGGGGQGGGGGGGSP